MISLQLIGKSFGAQPVLGTMDLELSQGDRIAILGPSGIGKSTLLRILARLDTRFEGNLTAPHNRALVFQEPTLLPWRSVAANICLATGVTREAAEEALAVVGLAAHADHFPGQLSLGQQRRVALARAMAARPDLLLLDEPFASLDADLAAEMRGLVAALLDGQQTTVILVTHAIEDASAIGAQPYRLAGTPATLTKSA